MLPANPTAFFLMLALVAFVIGLAKGGMGGILGSLAVPLLSLVLPARQVVGLLLPLLIVGDLPAIIFYWRKWDWKWIRVLLPGAIIGVMGAAEFIISVPARTLQIVLGVIVLLFALYKLFEKRILKIWQYHARNWHGYLAGTAAGITSALAHNGGPPVIVYLLMQDDMSALVFNATCAIFFAILNLVKLPFYLFAGLMDTQLLLHTLWVLPLIPLGVWIGIWAAQRIKPLVFERVILGLLGLTAVLLIVT
jgi:uncharacterized membrane protein YfcA